MADTSNLFGRGTSRIVATSVGCRGTELLLSSCYNSTVSLSNSIRYYGSHNAAGVICQGTITAPPECNHGDIQLVNGLKETEGRVEMCAYGYWAVVCGGNNWDITATRLLCKQLGMPTKGCN